MTDTNCGIALDTLPDVLTPVPNEHSAKPMYAFNAAESLGPAVMRYMDSRFESQDIEKHIHNMPVEAFYNLTVDEAAKIAFCAQYCLDDKIEKHLWENPVHLLIKKIRSSMWRWGYHRAEWNETVDAYNGLRSFDIGVEGFTVTLDHTRSYNERGTTEHSHTFIDGVFAYLVHYKGEHVMTIGFSIIEGHHILLQQVQLKKPRGNRWLFKFPTNRVEHAIERLLAAFPGYKMFIADGGDIAGTSLESYRTGLKRAKDNAKRYAQRLEADNDNSDVRRYLKEAQSDVLMWKDKIEHIMYDIPRLQELYRNSGRFTQGETLERGEIKHYALAA